MSLVASPGCIDGGLTLGVLTWTDRDVTQYLEYIEQIVETTALPVPERITRLQELGDDAAQFRPWSRLSRTNIPSTARNIAGYELCLQMRLRMARTLLAIERHRLSEGSLPDTLDSLIPDYFETMPLDFNGESLQYEQTDPGYVLKSIGFQFPPCRYGKMNFRGYTQECQFVVKR